MIRSRPPSAASAASKPGSSRTLRVPWSGMITCWTAASTSGSSPIAVRVATQSAGRLNVGIPIVTAAGAGRLDGRVPAALVQGERVVVRGQVEPVPAAVLERPQVERDVDLVHAAGAEHDPALVDLGALGLAAVDVDAAAALQAQLQPDLGERRPVPPVAGREGVEVRPERHLALLRQGRRGPRRDPQPPAGDRRALEVHGVVHDDAGRRRDGGQREAGPLVHVERADAHRVAGAGQDHPLEQRRHAVLHRLRAAKCLARGEVRGDPVVEHRQRRADRHVHVEVLVGAQAAAEQHVRVRRLLAGQLAVALQLRPVVRGVDRVVRLVAATPRTASTPGRRPSCPSGSRAPGGSGGTRGSG